MSKRDNELSRPELIEKRAKKLLEHFEVHRGQLPQSLIDGLTGLRDAVLKPVESLLKPKEPTEPAAGKTAEEAGKPVI
jgi:hypothetical protein